MDERCPVVSVIMACYNAEPYIGEAIGSVLAQTCGDTEVIVIDDGSSDASVSIVERLASEQPGRVHLERKSHAGPYPARNRGIELARGEFITFLDADDWWRKDCLELLLDALRGADADLAYCGWQNVGDHKLEREPFIPPAYEETDTVEAFLRGCPWPIHAALTRRSVLESVSGFSERLFSSMDYDLWLRILAHTTNMVRVPQALAYYRWHGDGQISANRWKQVVNAVQVRRDFVTAHPEKVRHIPDGTLEELVDGQLLREAYRTYWSHDLANAQKLFRAALARRACHPRDLKYILPALLPSRMFRGIVHMAGSARGTD